MVRVEIHKYPGLCGPFKECTKHMPDDNSLYFDRGMMNRLNSPAQATQQSSQLGEGTASVRNARRTQEGTTAAFPLLSTARQQTEGRERQAGLSLFRSNLLPNSRKSWPKKARVASLLMPAWRQESTAQSFLSGY